MIIRSTCDVESYPKSQQLVPAITWKKTAHLEMNKLSFFMLGVSVGMLLMQN